MKNSTKIILAGLAVAVTAGGAFAAEGWRKHGNGGPQRHAKEMFNKVDADSDGAITLDEMMQALTTRFDAADADANSTVTKAEIVTAMASAKDFPRAGRHSGRIADRIVFRLDLDDNGDVSRAEVENRAKKFFALADRNDDGKVEIAELRRLGGAMGKGRKGPGKDRRYGGKRFGGGWGSDDAGSDAQ